MFPGDQKPPFSIEFSGGELVVRREDEAEMAKVELKYGQDQSDTSFSATLVNIGGEQYVRIESDAVESGRLNYVVANDDGIGHGMIRLSVEPEFRTVVEPPLRDVTTVDEDGHLALVGQFQLDGNYTNGVKEVLRIKLDDSMPDGFRLYDSTDTDNPWTTIERDASGEYDAIQIDIQNPSALVMPENYHGEISYSFDLKSTAYTVDPIAGTTTPIFNAKSETDTITTTVSRRQSQRPTRPFRAS